jgi:putative oxidoreductase
MFAKVAATAITSLALRVALALILLFHGGLKVIQDGGAGWHAWLPQWVQVVVAWGELLAGFALLIGLCTRVAALGVIALMVGAVIIVTGQDVFVRTQIQAGLHGFNTMAIGYEYNFALIAMCVALVCLGGGDFSVDYCLAHARKAPACRAVTPSPVLTWPAGGATAAPASPAAAR